MAKLPVASYSFFNTYAICPRQAHHKYVLKDIPFEETPQLKRGNEVHSAMEKRVRDGTPLPDSMAAYEKFAQVFAGRPVKVEAKLGMRRDGSECDFFARDVWLRGKVDIAVMGPTNAFLADWKTGKRREDAHELEIQAVLVKAAYPQVTSISGAYVWLADDKLGVVHPLSQTEPVRAALLKTWETVEEHHRLEHWPPQEGPLCAWCDVKSCQFNRKGAR